MRQNVPKVSYVSFLDVWMVTCLVFVNGCMFEFILVTALVNRGMEGLGDKVTNIEKYICISVFFFSSNKVEQISRLLTPFAFGLFNLIYWPIVLSI